MDKKTDLQRINSKNGIIYIPSLTQPNRHRNTQSFTQPTQRKPLTQTTQTVQAKNTQIQQKKNPKQEKEDFDIDDIMTQFEIQESKEKLKNPVKSLSQSHKPITLPHVTPQKTKPLKHDPISVTHKNAVHQTTPRHIAVNQSQQIVTPQKSQTKSVVVDKSDISEISDILKEITPHNTPQKTEKESEKPTKQLTNSGNLVKSGRVCYVSAAFSLESKTSFTITFSNERFADVKMLFNHNNIKFDLVERSVMRISLGSYDAVLKLLTEQKLEFLNIHKIDDWVWKIVKMPDETGDIGRFEKIPQKIRDMLYGFQTEGVKFGLKKCGKFMLGDDMGLGKTIQTIAILSAYPELRPVLIVVPNILKLQWRMQLCDVLDVSDDDIAEYDPHVMVPGTNFVITSYDSVAASNGELFSHPFKYVVCDECHLLKNQTTKRATQTLEICRKVKHVVFMSGTPAVNRPLELFPVLSCLLDTIHSVGMKRFGDRYCANQTYSKYKDYTGSKYEKELNILLEKVMIRRLKIDVLKELGKKERERVYLEEPDMNDTLCQMKKDMTESNWNEKKGPVFELYRSTGLAKMPSVCGYIETVLEKEEKIVIFAYHVDVITGLTQFLIDKKINYVRIDGSTKADERGELVEKFKNEGCRVALLSIEVANCGVEFSSAAMCIFAELSFVPGKMIQAEDRIHRIGQKAKLVRIQYLIARNTYDETLWQIFMKKTATLGKIVDGKDAVLESKESNTDSFQAVKKDLFKGLLDVVSSYEKRKTLRKDIKLKAEKRKMGIEDVDGRDRFDQRVQKLSLDLNDEKSVSSSVSKIFDFVKK
ncbi:hypothetical protein EIN_020780 [Entamoeba invadens IP1]|uniref:hypothetical protein n=1 Tax=Entamoeba invadens IP1 TaxID=370355 RepID=UPI0002C3EF34|nr:hypothetical protein EIN_020780 [Entamoeba invadens IP1]ELP90599.1 hypothetical protein EIN_020780 [Entamoeba invadens IP1]|eukprot:XP_004257370.1 hypothetical protein EIN_020780 [Entamoeba invadens IP1]